MQKTAEQQIDFKRARTSGWLGVAMVCAVAIACLLLLWSHNLIVNGSPFHRWPWRSVPWSRVYPLTILSCVPLMLAQILWRRKGLASIFIALALLTATNISLQIIDGALRNDRYDLERIVDLIHNPIVTSYFTEAVILARQSHVLPFLADYPQLMDQFHMHATQKPPGQILYWYAWLQITQDGGGSALFGALGLALLASLSIPAIYWLARTIFENSDEAPTIAAIAATLFALSPSLVLYFPLFDSVYPAMTCAALASWLLALRTGRAMWAILCGLIFAAMFFLTFVPLVLGVTVVGYGVVVVAKRRANPRVAIRQALLVLGTIVAVYLALWLTTAYNPIATFFAALRNERALQAVFEIPHTYPHTMPSDVLDFFFGSAWVTLPVLQVWLMRRKASTEHNLLLLAGLFQIVLVTVAGLLRCETSRIWTFMQPLALIPIAAELARWSPRQRAAMYIAMWMLLSAMFQNLEVH
ncbi:MAG: hypothetical protein H7Z14_05075 [Anaerolineae bacterium]|nr:hypothetical protein [Phycisphaerae bacterium]